MPTFDYKCTACQKVEEHTKSISEEPIFNCSVCGALMERIFTVNTTGFILKGGTEAINYKEKRHRMKKSEEIAIKQKEKHGSGPKIRPNVAGMEVDSWSDAQKVAKEAGMNHESYTPFVEKEKKKIIV